MPDDVSGQKPAPAAQAKGTDDRSDAQKRIDELVGQKNDYQKKAAKYREELDSLKLKVAEMDGRNSVQPAAPTPKSNPRTWAEMSDDQLEDARIRARKEELPDALDAIFEEKTRRIAAAAEARAIEKSNAKAERAQLLRDVHQRVIAEYGPDAFDPEKPLYQGANRYLSEIRRIYGDESASQPHRLLDAFVHADRDTRVIGERQRLAELEQENKALRDRATLAERAGHIGSNARALSDEAKAALKAGDRKGAIRRTAIAQSMAAEVKAHLLPPRS